MKCEHCNAPLSHERRKGVYRCPACYNAYLLIMLPAELTKREANIEPKNEPSNDIVADHEVRKAEMEVERRCTQCGGPLKNLAGTFVWRCAWCGEEYALVAGELSPRPPEPKPKMNMRDFYALHGSLRSSHHRHNGKTASTTPRSAGSWVGMQEGGAEFTLLLLLHASLPPRLPDQYGAELRWNLEHNQPLPEGWVVKACEAFRTSDPEEHITLREYVRDVFGLRPLQDPWNDRVVFADPQTSLGDFAESKEE